MHPAPAYARLQILSRIRAEVLQRLRGLSTAVVFDTLESPVRQRLALAIAAFERALRDLEDEYLFNDGPVAKDAHSLERQCRAELEWLTDLATELSKAVQSDSLAVEVCDRIIAQVKERRSNEPDQVGSNRTASRQLTLNPTA